MTEGVRYAIGPLTTWAAPDELTTWLRAAAPGHRCTYAVGPALSDHPTRRLAAEAAQRGEAHLFQQREGKGWRYLIEKRAATPPPEGPPRRLRIDPEFELTETGRLYRALCTAAREGLPTPSHAEMAELADLPDRHAARYRLQCLERQGRVIVRGEGAGRTVEIAGKGWSTTCAR